MRNIFFIAIFFFIASNANAQLWFEDFVNESNGAQSGTASGSPGGTWGVDVDPSGTFAVQDDQFRINNTGTEGTWSTNAIDISSAGYAIIDIGYGSYGFGFSNSDYIRFYYRIDNGPEVLFANIQGDVWDVNQVQASAIVAGNTLEVIIKAVDNSSFIFLGGTMWVSDVTVTAAPIIYSRKSGTWTDVAAGSGTWSLTGHVGAACGCRPLNTQVAIIGTGHTVTLPASQTNIGNPATTNLAPGAVDVYGTLQYNTNAVTLGVQQGLFRVRSTGVVNSSSGAISDERIQFQANIGGATFQVDPGGSITIEDLVLSAAATNSHRLTGSGTLDINDDILIDAAGSILTNDRTSLFTVGGDFDFNATSTFINNGAITINGSFLVDANNSSFTNNSGGSLTIGNNLNFNADNSIFTNNGSFSIAGDISANNTDDDGNEVINSGSATLSFTNMDGLATTTGDGAFLSILNSGTINQSGTFLDIQNSTNGSNDINNLGGGIWNYAGTGHDADLRLFANNGTNDFNYIRNGAQNIITPVSGNGYSNVSLQTSGAKTAQGSFNVYGNWSRSGGATFAPAGYTVTFSGGVAQSITASGVETFAGLTIDNDFGASPQITIFNNITVTGVLTMLDGNVNLNGNTLTLSSSAAGALAHSLAAPAGWMYGGSFTRARPASAAFMATLGAADAVRALFPLGSAADWRPFFVGQTLHANTAGLITVSHTNSTSTSDVSIPDTNPNATIVKRHNSFWTVSTSGVGAGATFYLRAAGTNFGIINNSSHLRMATSTGVVGTNISGSGTSANFRVNRSVLFANLANSFHVASTNAASSPLPIELLSFSVQRKNNFVELKWSTATETDNDFFTIERASNVEQFESILEHDGSGTTKELNEYNIIDPSPLYGRSYYRLKQIDFDGKFTYSSVRVIDYEGPEHGTLTVFPNPLSGKNLFIKIEGLRDATQVPVQILNMQGQKVYEKTIRVKTPGVINEQISREKVLPSGVYIVKAGSTLYLTQKIVVE